MNRLCGRAAMRPRLRQLLQMKRQRRRRQRRRSRDGAGGQALRRVLDQQPKHGEAVFLRQRAQCHQCSFCFHISNIMETLARCQPSLPRKRAGRVSAASGQRGDPLVRAAQPVGHVARQVLQDGDLQQRRRVRDPAEVPGFEDAASDLGVRVDRGAAGRLAEQRHLAEFHARAPGTRCADARRSAAASGC